MGLDVYLSKSDDIDAHLAWDERRDEFAESVPYEQGDSGEAYRARMAAWDAENPDPAPSEGIEINSSVHPDHLFKIGYLRSSYNEGGIERVLGNTIGKGLHDIFETDGNEYIVRPDWPACLRRAVGVRDEFDRYIKEHGSYGVSEMSNMFGQAATIDSDEKAMALFRSELAEHRNSTHAGFGSYSNNKGNFYLDQPLKVAAVIQGIGCLSSISGRKIPAVYVVYEKNMEFYQQALRITAEMIEWVISKPDPQKFYLRWSG